MKPINYFKGDFTMFGIIKLAGRLIVAGAAYKAGEDLWTNVLRDKCNQLAWKIKARKVFKKEEL
jgi:hypothetical protein